MQFMLNCIPVTDFLLCSGNWRVSVENQVLKSGFTSCELTILENDNPGGVFEFSPLYRGPYSVKVRILFHSSFNSCSNKLKLCCNFSMCLDCLVDNISRYMTLVIGRDWPPLYTNYLSTKNIPYSIIHHLNIILFYCIHY